MDYYYLVYFKIKYPHKVGLPLFGEGTTDVRRNLPIRNMADVIQMQDDILVEAQRQFPDAESILIVSWQRFGV